MENIPVSRLTRWSLLTDISGGPLPLEDSGSSSTAPQPKQGGGACSDISKPPESTSYLGSGHFTEKAT